MKKQALFFVAAIAALSLHAQVKVAGNGNMSIQGDDSMPQSALSIGSSGDSIYKVYVESDKNGFNVRRKGQMLIGTGVSSISYNESTSLSYGLSGKAISESATAIAASSNRAFGVMGEAYGAQNYNFGVFGRLGGNANSYGAAIYGTVSPMDNGTMLNQRYAGFFNGNVGVQGGLNVHGYINGTVIGTCPPLVPISRLSAESADFVIDKLGTLETFSYYNEPTATALSAANTGQSTATVADMADASRRHYALNVEQLEEVYPELVYDLGDGKKGINYVELVPILVQGINELKAEVEQLKAAASSQRTQRNTTAVDETMVETDIPTLAQNDPNPFETSSTIRLNVPESVGEALLVFYDLNGKQIKQVSVETRGSSEHTVTSADFAPGMYIYALVTDGEVVETRRMLLLK